jgi:hypothetical protein
MSLNRIRIAMLVAIASLTVAACNLSDDAPPVVGNSSTNNPANNDAGGNLDVGPGNAGTFTCSGDTTGCSTKPGATATECAEGVCIYQCDDGFFDANLDLESPDSDGCEASCIPTNDGMEVCDGLDNDCNGTIDDGFDVGEPCSDGEGACLQEGTIACDPDGSSSSCSAVAGTATDEVCDGIDNDCDGQVDEGNAGGGGTCDTGQPGACQNGTELCTNAQITCEPNEMAVTEDCGADNTGDGIDNDCDGEVDEGCGNCPEGDVRSCYTGPRGTESVGECSAGQQQCLNGNYQACLGATLPATELCNGLDDDCDGEVDEGFGVGDRCVTGVGVCRAGGSLACDRSGIGTFCDAQTVAPSAEICDGLDNDCDGTVDEDFPGLGNTCTEGVGACRDTGTVVCDGNLGTTCSATPGIPSRELCGDRIDNDCDGTADEGCSLLSSCRPSCLSRQSCCTEDRGRTWSCYSLIPIGAMCE